jgi:RNA polymerase sigma-70 factor (ECF subfamily)
MSNYEHIVIGVREHNAQSQMMFYDMFIRSVFRTAYAIVENESEAEEIAQDTMLKVFDRIDLLNDDAGAMERVMRRIASNAAIDVTRRRKDFIFSSENLPDFEDAGNEDDRFDFSIEEIKEAIATLSVSHRNILSLRLFEDMSFAEVAELLDVNYSTVRVQYTRGIAKLRNCLIKKKNYV